MKNSNTFVLRTQAAREFPDPEKGIKHYVLLCKANAIPSNVPLDPNPRDQNINRSVAKDVRKSLIDSTDLTFHLKNKGITMLADSVRLDGQKFRADVNFCKGQGIVDGGHTYKVIQDVSASEDEEIPENQFVKIEILTGIPSGYVSAIAGGLNTSLQVADTSLENLKGHFDWIKEELTGESYADKISYRENAPGDVSVREVIALLTMFIPDQSGHPKKAHPKMAYSQKAQCLKAFQDNPEDYKKMRPILKDIFQLHDYILYHARKKYNEEVSGGRGAALVFMQKKKRGAYRLHFMNEDIELLMHDGALYPILGAFRYLIEKRDGKIGWKFGCFEKVRDFCDAVLGEMMVSTQKTSSDLGRRIEIMGKNDLHWDSLYHKVAIAVLEKNI